MGDADITLRHISRRHAKRLHRALTAGEQQSLDARARSAPDEAQEKLLALEGEALAAWLRGPDTR